MVALHTSTTEVPQTVPGEGKSRHEPIWIKDGAADMYAPEAFLVTPHYKESISAVMIPRGLVIDRIEKLAIDIRDVYGDAEVHLLCVLKGSRGFFSQLVEILSRMHRYSEKKLQTPPYLEHYVRIKSYVNTESTGTLQVQSDDLSELKGKHVLIVEDIIDTGNTLSKFCNQYLQEFEPASVKAATLLEKRHDRSVGFKADFVGFSVPDEFIVGYCLDYNEYFRDLEHICILNNAAVKKYAIEAPKKKVDPDDDLICSPKKH